MADARPSSPSPTSPRSSGGSRAAGYALGALLLLLAGLVLGLAAFLFLVPARQGTEYLATAAVVTLPAGAAVVVSPTDAASATPPATATPLQAPTPSSMPTDGSPTPVATITPLSGGALPDLPLPPAATLPAGAVNLLQNGDFAADWAVGWERSSDGLNGGATVDVLSLAGDPPLPVLLLAKSGAGTMEVAQHVVLTGPVDDLVFRGQMWLAGGAGGGQEGRAAVQLRFEDADGQLLGTSVFLDGSAGETTLDAIVPPTGPVSTHLAGAGRQSVTLALGPELAGRLPTIDPANVRRVTVALVVAGSATCAPDACQAMLEAAALSLAAEGS